MLVSVCLSVCPHAHNTNSLRHVGTIPNFERTLPVARFCLWWRRDTSGFVDDIMLCFPVMGPIKVSCAVAVSLQCRICQNTPAACYWLRPLTHDPVAKTRPVLRERGDGVKYVIHHCLAVCLDGQYEKQCDNFEI